MLACSLCSRAFEDMISVRQCYKSVMNAPDRFQPSTTVELKGLHHTLGNTNLAAALPDLKQDTGSADIPCPRPCSP